MSGFKSFARRSGYVASIALMTLTLGSCELAKNQLTYDRAAELDRQQYRDALAPVALPPEDVAAVPDFQPVVSTPAELKLPSPLVTVSVNQTVSLRDLMFELADQADIDLELDPQIQGSIIFTAKQRPFDEVISRICDMSGLRYKFENNVLRVELDRPYIKTYPVAFLDAGRKGSSDINASVTMGSSGGGGGEGGSSASTSGGSTAEIASSFDGDLWKELQENIEQILTSSDTHVSLATLSDPVPMVINPMPVPVSNDPNNPVPPPLPGQAGQVPAAVPPTLSVTSVAGAPLIPNPPATFSISRQSGAVTVFASERQQKQVASFIREFQRRLMTQIVIEAKVLQVDLTDEYATGIDWRKFNLTGMANVDINMPSPGLSPDTTGSVTGVLSVGDMNVAIQAISRFGTVRALSSPRVTVLNNQPALVNVAQNNVYFNYDVETTEDSDTNETRVSIESEQRSTPEGVILTVVPAANPDTGEVTMIVRPTVSRITSTVTDPTVAFSLAAIGINPVGAGVPDNQIPEVSVQEIDSILRLQSGQIAVMGGLMKDTNNVVQESVPVLGDIPFFGNAFRSTTDKVEKSELVIFIKASIVPGSNIEDMDRKIYNTFGNDRRPARM